MEVVVSIYFIIWAILAFTSSEFGYFCLIILANNNIFIATIKIVVLPFLYFYYKLKDLL